MLSEMVASLFALAARPDTPALSEDEIVMRVCAFLLLVPYLCELATGPGLMAG